MGWFSSGQFISEVAREIAAQFESGPIIFMKLDPLGISELSVNYLGKVVWASWYRSGNARSLTLDGGSYPASDDAEAIHIIKAAQRRATRLASEEMARWEQLRVKRRS